MTDGPLLSALSFPINSGQRRKGRMLSLRISLWWLYFIECRSMTCPPSEVDLLLGIYIYLPASGLRPWGTSLGAMRFAACSLQKLLNFDLGYISFCSLPPNHHLNSIATLCGLLALWRPAWTIAWPLDWRRLIPLHHFPLQWSFHDVSTLTVCITNVAYLHRCWLAVMLSRSGRWSNDDR